MGHPKKMRRLYETPHKPWDKARVEKERKIMESNGLRRKKELRVLETTIRNLRRRARELIALKDEKAREMLVKKVREMGLISKADMALEDILGIELENILERRLQTQVLKKGLANTRKQARQFITHGHIMVNGRKVISPGYLVTLGEENELSFRQTSSLNSTFKKSETADAKDAKSHAASKADGVKAESETSAAPATPVVQQAPTSSAAPAASGGTVPASASSDSKDVK